MPAINLPKAQVVGHAAVDALAQKFGYPFAKAVVEAAKTKAVLSLLADSRIDRKKVDEFIDNVAVLHAKFADEHGLDVGQITAEADKLYDLLSGTLRG